MFRNLNKYFLTTSKQEFSRYFLLTLKYKPETYYHSYQHRSDIYKELKDIQHQGKSNIIGGNHFPMNFATIIFNCDDKSIPQNYILKSYLHQYVQKWTIIQCQKLSKQNISKLVYHYQFK